MKTILMMAVSVFMFNSTSFAQAMQSTEIVAQMDAQLEQNSALIDQAASFLPSGSHLGRRSALSPLVNCSVTVAPTPDNGGGLIANIESTSVLDIMGSKSKSLASMSVYDTDVLTEISKVTANEVIVGYKSELQNGLSQTLKITKLSENKALVTITDLAHGKEIKSTSCRIKVN